MRFLAIRLRSVLERATHLVSHQSPGVHGAKGGGRRLPAVRSAFWPAAIAGAFILLTLIALPGGSGGEVTVTVPFAASEDTFVKSTRPTTNYGQDDALEADTSPSHKRILLRFQVTGIPPSGVVRSATLRMFVVDESDRSGTVYRVVGPWDERSAKWENAPSIGSEAGRFPGSASEDQWKEADVRSAVTGNGNVEFYILTTSTNGVDYSSTEADQHPPTLVVSWSTSGSQPQPTPSPTPTPAPATGPQPLPTAGPTPVAGLGRTYYVDSASGNDSNSGTSESAAWRSLGRASSFTLSPGDRLLFKRGGAWSGTLTISESGTSDKPVFVGSYGSGALPVIQGGSDCVIVSGTRIIVSQLQVSNCGWAGVKFPSGSGFNRLDGSLITGNVAGVYVSSGASDNTVVGNTIRDNTKMSVLTPGGDDDSGAFGVLLNGDRTEVAHNTISGHDTFSYDYVRDGAAVEVYGGQGNHVHHNLAIDNETFSELGNSRSRDNTFAYNVVRSSLSKSFFLVTRGSGSGYGPVANTKLLNNTVVMTGNASQGFVCHAGCNSSILSMRNNVIQAVVKVGYADGSFDEDYNIYAGGQVQFNTGSHTMVTNPMFINAAAGDLHLASGSPAIDSAVTSGYLVDFDGALVPSDGNGDGVVATDRGAFEKNSGPVAAPPPTPGPTPAPTPAPPPTGGGGEAVLVGAGDIAGCGTNGDEATANLLDNIPGTVFTLGDSVYEDGTAQQFADCYNPSWGRHKARTKPVVGNHEYHTAGGSGYYGYFRDAATPLQPGCTSGCKGWYSYNTGSWHVIVLNSECSTSYQACNMSEMDQWLRADLAANPAACTVAMWHRPVLTIGPHNNDEGSLKPLWRILHDNNVDLVLNGHEHSYQRYAPLNREANGVDTARGIRQIVVGTGGKGLTTSSRAGSTPGLEVWQDASTANTLGVLKLTLRDGNFGWQFVPVAGKSFSDSGSGNCH